MRDKVTFPGRCDACGKLIRWVQRQGAKSPTAFDHDTNAIHKVKCNVTTDTLTLVMNRKEPWRWTEEIG